MQRDALGLAMGTLSGLARSGLTDRLGLRKTIESLTYHGTRTGFQTLGALNRPFRQVSKLKQAIRLSTPTVGVDRFDLTLTEEQQMIQDSVRRLAEKQVRPAAAEANETRELPESLKADFQELGLNIYAVPESLGGVASENTLVTQMVVAEALGWGDMGLAVALLSPLSVANTLTRWGTGEQQATYLPAFLEAHGPAAALAISESRPLFDPMQLKTTATPSEIGYRLNGEKTLVPLCDTSELFLVAATLHGKPRLFIVEAGHPGISVRLDGSMGLKAARMGTLKLTDVQLPERALLGDADFDYAEMLQLSRLAWCALAVGNARAVLDYVIPYCNTRIAFGEPISHRQAVAFMIANLKIELDAMQIMTQRAVALAEQGKPFIREASLAHILCAEKSMEIGTNGVQLLGGHGFTKEHPVERWYRDLRSVAFIAGGLHL